MFVEHCVPGAGPLLDVPLAKRAMQVHVKQSLDPNTSQLQRDVGHLLGQMQASADYSVRDCGGLGPGQEGHACSKAHGGWTRGRREYCSRPPMMACWVGDRLLEDIYMLAVL